MRRFTLIIASPHAPVTSALAEFARLFLPQIHLEHRILPVQYSCAGELFEELDAIEPNQLRDTMVVLDMGGEDAGAWDVQNMYDAGMAAQLVLSFPEVYFVFLGSSDGLKAALPDARPSDWSMLDRHHFVANERLIDILPLIALHAHGFRTIFDATGLRSCLKELLINRVGGERAKVYAPVVASRRACIAAVADEESAFVYLDGYATHKFGYRVWLLTTESEFDRVLRHNPHVQREALTLGQPPRVAGPENVNAVVSDWDLVYPDHMGPPDKSLLLPDRLRKDICIMLITGFQEREQEQLLVTHQGLRAPKPYGGLFDLLASEEMVPNRRNCLAERDNEVWPQVRDSMSGQDSQQPGNHTAPYARGVVANRLLARARKLAKTESKETESWVQVALLAGEAKEILGGLSRTTAYESVALQNEAEVIAEISFFGTLAQSRVERRLTRLEEETQLMLRLNPGLTSEAQTEANIARLNCLLQTVNTLRLRFSEHEQVNASEECLRYVARYHSQLDRFTVCRPFVRVFGPGKAWQAFDRVCALLRYAMNRYLDLATDAGTSVCRLTWVSGVWIFSFGLFYFLLLCCFSPDAKPVEQKPGAVYTYRVEVPFAGDNKAPVVTSAKLEIPPTPADSQAAQSTRLDRGFILAMWHSCLTFVLQPSISEIEQDQGAYGYMNLRVTPLYRIAMMFELLIAYVHLGLLLSLLYRRITKRAP